MEGNPYSMLISKIREDISGLIPTAFRMGKVSCGSPLRIEVVGIIQTADALLKNAALTEPFVVDETLLLLPIEDEQRYIILCKVVSA